MGSDLDLDVCTSCDWFGDLRAQFPDLEISIEKFAAIEGDQMVEVLRIQGRGWLDGLIFLDNHPEVQGVTIVSQGQGQLVIQLDVPVCGPVKALRETSVMIQFPIKMKGDHEHWRIPLQTIRHEPLKEALEKEGVEFS